MLKKLDQEIYDLLKIHSTKPAYVDVVSKVTKSVSYLFIYSTNNIFIAINN